MVISIQTSDVTCWDSDNVLRPHSTSVVLVVELDRAAHGTKLPIFNFVWWAAQSSSKFKLPNQVQTTKVECGLQYTLLFFCDAKSLFYYPAGKIVEKPPRRSVFHCKLCCFNGIKTLLHRNYSTILPAGQNCLQNMYIHKNSESIIWRMTSWRFTSSLQYITQWDTIKFRCKFY